MHIENVVGVYNFLAGAWEAEEPAVDGPIELYAPVEDGTENAGPEENIDAEFHGEYPTLAAALTAIDSTGTWYWSRPYEGRYLGRIISRAGTAAVITF